jgi:hypothetical protein
MATKRSSSSPKTVALRDRDGNTYDATNAAEINTLVYGQGYTPVDTKTSLSDQIAALVAAEPSASAPAAATPQAPSTTA